MQNSIIELKTFLILCKKKMYRQITLWICLQLNIVMQDEKKYTIEKVFYVIIKVVVT